MRRPPSRPHRRRARTTRVLIILIISQPIKSVLMKSIRDDNTARRWPPSNGRVCVRDNASEACEAKFRWLFRDFERCLMLSKAMRECKRCFFGRVVILDIEFGS